MPNPMLRLLSGWRRRELLKAAGKVKVPFNLDSEIPTSFMDLPVVRKALAKGGVPIAARYERASPGNPARIAVDPDSFGPTHERYLKGEYRIPVDKVEGLEDPRKFLEFLLNHEGSHHLRVRREGESLVAYENRMNRHAAEGMQSSPPLRPPGPTQPLQGERELSRRVTEVNKGDRAFQRVARGAKIAPTKVVKPPTGEVEEPVHTPVVRKSRVDLRPLMDALRAEREKAAKGGEPETVRGHHLGQLLSSLNQVVKGKAPVRAQKGVDAAVGRLTAGDRTGPGSPRALSTQAQALPAMERLTRLKDQDLQMRADEAGVDAETGEYFGIPSLIHPEADSTKKLLKWEEKNPGALEMSVVHRDKKTGAREEHRIPRPEILPKVVDGDRYPEKREKGPVWERLSEKYLESGDRLEVEGEMGMPKGRSAASVDPAFKTPRGGMTDMDVRGLGDPAVPGEVARNVAKMGKKEERVWEDRDPPQVQPHMRKELQEEMTSFEQKMAEAYKEAARAAEATGDAYGEAGKRAYGKALKGPTTDAVEAMTWLGVHSPADGHQAAQRYPSVAKAVGKKIEKFRMDLTDAVKTGKVWDQELGRKRPMTEGEWETYPVALKWSAMARDLAPVNPAVAAVLLKAFGMARFDGADKGAAFVKKQAEAAISQLYHVRGDADGRFTFTPKQGREMKWRMQGLPAGQVGPPQDLGYVRGKGLPAVDNAQVGTGGKYLHQAPGVKQAKPGDADPKAIPRLLDRLNRRYKHEAD